MINTKLLQFHFPDCIWLFKYNLNTNLFNWLIKFTSLGPLDLSTSIEEAHEKDVYRKRKLGTIANLSSKSQKNVSDMRYWTFEKKDSNLQDFFPKTFSFGEPFFLRTLFVPNFRNLCNSLVFSLLYIKWTIDESGGRKVTSIIPNRRVRRSQSHINNSE